MKKFLLLCLIVLFSEGVMARTAAERAAAKALKDQKAEAEMLNALDMKIFHDRQIVQGVLLNSYNQQNSSGNKREKTTQVVLSERDSNIIENKMNDKNIKYNVTPELMEKANEKPFEAFKDLVKTATVAKITKEEISELGTVDKKAIPEMLQMMTESGNDFGTKQVSVIYDNETQD